MTDSEKIVRRRMHGLFLTRKCPDLLELSRELLGLHSWFYRNVCFSALIRGADIRGWKTALTKTWLYRGTLHGVAFDDLPTLLALHSGGEAYLQRFYGEELIERLEEDVLNCMEDGVYSRSEMRVLFADRYEPDVIDSALSPWGGIFVSLARRGKVAFRDMASRDFDLISAEPTETPEQVLPELLTRYFAAYGPATLADAASFFGLDKRKLSAPEALNRLEIGKVTYYFSGELHSGGGIPELTLLSGFDPLIVAYTERSAILPAEYKGRVILKSGICNPTIAVNGRVAGIWNIRKSEPVAEFFAAQPKRISDAALERVDEIRWRTTGRM